MHHSAIQDGANYPVKCDPISSSQSALVTETLWDALTREGKVFSVAASAAVGAVGVKEWLLAAPNTTTRCYLRVWIGVGPGAGGVGSPGRADLYENPTIGVGGVGTALAELNLDRNSATAATLVATEDPNIGADGTLLCSVTAGAGVVLVGAQGEAALQRGAFRILKQNEQYLIRWTDLLAGSTVALYAEWAEV